MTNKLKTEKKKPKSKAMAALKMPTEFSSVKSPYNQLAYNPDLDSERSGQKALTQSIKAIERMESANPGPLNSRRRKPLHD